MPIDYRKTSSFLFHYKFTSMYFEIKELNKEELEAPCSFEYPGVSHSQMKRIDRLQKCAGLGFTVITFVTTPTWLSLLVLLVINVWLRIAKGDCYLFCFLKIFSNFLYITLLNEDRLNRLMCRLQYIYMNWSFIQKHKDKFLRFCIQSPNYSGPIPAHAFHSFLMFLLRVIFKIFSRIIHLCSGYFWYKDA